MAQLKILEKTRAELKTLKRKFKPETAESMSQIVARLTHAEFLRMEKEEKNKFQPFKD